MTGESETIVAPWTVAQVEALNAYQSEGLMHPFTCGGGRHSDRALVATLEGWTCSGCDYRQDWAHAWMADPAVLERLREFYRGMRS